MATLKSRTGFGKKSEKHDRVHAQLEATFYGQVVECFFLEIYNFLWNHLFVINMYNASFC